jgi:tetratricopeptide (TPR) repeat protein
MDDEFKLEIEAAKEAHDRGDIVSAIDHWKRCVNLDPNFVQAYLIGGTALLQIGRFEEAEVMLSKSTELDPDNIPLAVEHAKAATRLKNWSESIRRWSALSLRAPDVREVIDGRIEADWQIQTYRMSEAPGHGPTDKDWEQFSTSRIKTADTELFMQFQSLGDNCEFGLVQRHFQAEPISLLRWSSISLDSLIKIVNADFPNIGAPATTELAVGAHDEYVLADHANGIVMHTFLFKGQIKENQNELFEKMCRRQSYLKRQILEDLADGEQIFVFKSFVDTDLKAAKKLHAALQRHGRCNLLFAVEADKRRRAGSVEEIAAGLYVGAIDHFTRPGDGWDNIPFDDWRSVCHEVLRRTRSAARLKNLLNRVFGKGGNSKQSPAQADPNSPS